ncbi:MAG: DNA internalization-related competence protein ComEC/Rec2 [Clostridia bacterium]|nr:DNA internalization-related competence protein ComEC/Rec2 [Clostridia bacterium]
MKNENAKPVILPVRRKLMAVTIAYLIGILASGTIAVPRVYTGILCALFVVAALLRRRHRKSILLCLMLFACCLGCFRASSELMLRDQKTGSGAAIEGTVAAIEREYRVYLSDVRIDGERTTRRNVLVTLMVNSEAEEKPPEVYVGQRISGTGRLFEQEEVRNPGGINQRIRALCDGYELSGYILPGWGVNGEACFSFGETLRKARAYIGVRIDEHFGHQAPLFMGMMLGDKRGMEQEFASALRLTGTAHILTVSGLHLSMIAAVIGWLIRRMPIGRGLGFCVQGIFLIGFTGLTGAAPGTVRACIMSLMREWARIRGKKYEPLSGLAAAALGMTLVSPLLAMHTSFQFSFFVVLGIQLLMPGMFRLAKCLRHLHSGLGYAANAVSVSLAAQIAALPMQLMLYGYVPVLSLPMNVLCGSLMPVMLLGAWGCMLLSWVFMPGARVLSRILISIADAFEILSIQMAAFNWSILRLPAPSGFSVLLFAVFMMLVSSIIRLGRMRKAACALVIVCLAGGYALRFDPSARYVQLDVGQGDAAVIRKGRSAVLFDVGPSDSYDMLRYLRHEGLALEGVILSHLDEDHAGALGTLINSEIDIPVIVMAYGAVDREVSLAVEEALDKALLNQIDIRTVRAGDSMSVMGMDIQVLSPMDHFEGSNDRSLLLYAQMEGVSMMLTGDLPSAREPVILPRCDLLKVAHHGSKYASSDAFLNTVQPELALISVGANNSYGHPGERVLNTLEQIGARVLRTDESGCITVFLRDGQMMDETFLKDNLKIGA